MEKMELVKSEIGEVVVSLNGKEYRVTSKELPKGADAMDFLALKVTGSAVPHGHGMSVVSHLFAGVPRQGYEIHPAGYPYMEKMARALMLPESEK